MNWVSVNCPVGEPAVGELGVGELGVGELAVGEPTRTRANYAISMAETQLSFTRYMSEKCTHTIKSTEPNALGQFFVELKNKTIEMFVKNNWIKCKKYVRNLFI